MSTTHNLQRFMFIIDANRQGAISFKRRFLVERESADQSFPVTEEVK